MSYLMRVPDKEEVDLDLAENSKLHEQAEEGKNVLVLILAAGVV
jgi:hypothetical protein